MTGHIDSPSKQGQRRKETEIRKAPSSFSHLAVSSSTTYWRSLTLSQLVKEKCSLQSPDPLLHRRTKKGGFSDENRQPAHFSTGISARKRNRIPPVISRAKSRGSNTVSILPLRLPSCFSVSIIFIPPLTIYWLFMSQRSWTLSPSKTSLFKSRQSTR